MDNTIKTKIIISLLLIIACRIDAQNFSWEQLEEARDIPDLGIYFRPPNGFKALPLPTAPVFYVSKEGKKLEFYNPYDLWLDEQPRVAFKSNWGVIKLVNAAVMPPARHAGSSNQQLEKDVFAQRHDAFPVRWELPDLQAWIDYLAQTNGNKLNSRVSGITLPAPYYKVDFTADIPATKQAYLINLKTTGKEQIIYVEFDILESDKKIQKKWEVTFYKCLRSIRPSWTAAKEKKNYGNMQNRQLLNLRNPSSDAYKDAKARVIASINMLPDWWYVETPHYVIASDLPNSKRLLVNKIQLYVEIFRKGFVTLIDPIKPINEVSVIRVFNTHQDYVSYIDPSLQNTVGLWSPSNKELMISTLNFQNQYASYDTVLEVVCHEGFHQYLFYALDRVSAPVWFDEGHATFFEAGEINPTTKNLRVYENPKRMALLQELLQDPGALDLQALVKLDHNAFYGKDQPDTDSQMKVLRNYAQAWGLVYFFRKASPLFGSKPYGKVCDRMISALSTPPIDPKRANELAFTGIDMGVLQRDFIAFWKSNNARQRVKKLPPFP